MLVTQTVREKHVKILLDGHVFKSSLINAKVLGSARIGTKGLMYF